MCISNRNVEKYTKKKPDNQYTKKRADNQYTKTKSDDQYTKTKSDVTRSSKGVDTNEKSSPDQRSTALIFQFNCVSTTTIATELELCF